MFILPFLNLRDNYMLIGLKKAFFLEIFDKILAKE